MKKLFLIYLIIIPLFSYSQKDSVKLYEPKQIIDDIDSLIAGLHLMHPTYHKYYQENNLKSKIDSFKRTLTQPVPSIDLFRFMQPIVSIDGHTSLIFTDDIYPKFAKRFFPFKVLFYKNLLYVKENISINKEIAKGSIIETINGIPAKQVVDNLIRYVPGEKYDYKTKKLEDIFHTYYSLVYGPCNEFTIKLKNSKKLYKVEAAENKQFNQQVRSNFELKFFDDDIAYIYCRKFSPPKEFLRFMDSAFHCIKEKNIKYLIIDNSKNSGGLGDLGDTLASYFTSKPYFKVEQIKSKLGPFIAKSVETDKPIGHIEGDYFVYGAAMVTPVERKNKFNGKTFILCSIRTYSAGTFFLASVKCSNTANIVGEETGQPLISNGNIDQFKLPNTKMKCASALSTYYMPCNNGNLEMGVVPDYPVKPTIDDLLNDKNYILDYVLKIIRD